MKKFFIFLICLIIFSIPLAVCLAQNASEEIFKAKVVKILEEKELIREDGSKALQQNILLKGLEGEWKNKEIEYQGISEIDVVSAGIYKVGDKVFVAQTTGADGNDQFAITDYDRIGSLFWLAIIFSLVILTIGKFKGLRALLSLMVSFYVIIKFILPRILSGSNPLLIGLVGSFIILAIIIYLTEGCKKKSHLAVVSVLFSLLITLILSWIFTLATRLTGLAQEESMFLIGATKNAIDFQGLLLAGILIGTIGVLDDIIVGQIEAVIQIKEANPNLPNSKVYQAAYKVGNAHLGAIINTLFLTYAGVSLPLLLLFSIQQEPFLTFSQVINNELIATEIVRTLVGSIGIVLAMPIATILAVKFFSIKNINI